MDSMNKKVVGIIILVIFVVLAIAGVFMFSSSNSNSSGGLDSSIQNEDDRVGNTNLDSDRVLVLYFSETGNTQKLANLISQEVGGDFRRIEPETPYPTGDELFDYTEEEANSNARPKFKDLDINMDDYDTIFIGYPIWWYQMPMIMYTFFDEYDLSDKTIVPFNTHEGSGNSGTYQDIAEMESDATVLDGLAIRGGDMDSDQTDTVRNWLEDLGFNE